ncbi:MAG: hypothetical protein LBK66_10825 [Spirochaetaceae bacterium]|jgi:hypothetical protein|nr:hypothetical protein [Spirochaetaceae bacterium]
MADNLAAYFELIKNIEYSASTCKVITDTRGFFKISFGRIFGCAGNSGLSGVPSLAWSMATCGGPAPPEANPQDLRPLAHFDAPKEVDIIPMIDNLVTDFELIPFG